MFKNITHSMQWPCSGMSGMCDERSGMDTSLSEEKYGVDLMRSGSENIKVEYRVRQYNSADGDYYELKGWRQIGDGFYEFSVSVDKHAILQGGPTILEFSYSVIDAAYFSLSSQVDVVGNWRRLYTLILESRLVRACEEGEDYRFGWNTQEKVDEIAGAGNHYTAEFWEYDPRAVLRWNTDPKPHPSWSPYSIMQGNPIWYTDHKGDTVRTNSEGFQNTTMAMEGILDGKANPIGFDADKGILTYDDNMDISGYSDFQKDVLGRYKELIGNTTDVNLKIVDVNDKIEDAGGLSLNDLGAAGITVPFKYQNGSIAHQNVYVARNPVKSDGSAEKKEYAGITNIHELGGHAFLHLTQPALKKNEHNKLVEELHKKIFLNFKINGAIWYKRSAVPLHPREEE